MTSRSLAQALVSNPHYVQVQKLLVQLDDLGFYVHDRRSESNPGKDPGSSNPDPPPPGRAEDPEAEGEEGEEGESQTSEGEGETSSTLPGEQRGEEGETPEEPKLVNPPKEGSESDQPKASTSSEAAPVTKADSNLGKDFDPFASFDFAVFHTNAKGDTILSVNLQRIRQAVLLRVKEIQEQDPLAEEAAGYLNRLSRFELTLAGTKRPRKPKVPAIHSIAEISFEIKDQASGKGPAGKSTYPTPTFQAPPQAQVKRGKSLRERAREFTVKLGKPTASGSLSKALGQEFTAPDYQYSDEEDTPDCADIEEEEEERLTSKSGTAIEYEERFHTSLTLPQQYSPEIAEKIRQVAVDFAYAIDCSGQGGVSLAVENEPPFLIKNHRLPAYIDFSVTLSNGDCIEDTIFLDYVATRTVKLVPIKKRLCFLSAEHRREIGLAQPVVYDPRDLVSLSMARSFGNPETARAYYRSIRARARSVPTYLTEKDRRLAYYRVNKALDQL